MGQYRIKNADLDLEAIKWETQKHYYVVRGTYRKLGFDQVKAKSSKQCNKYAAVVYSDCKANH